MILIDSWQVGAQTPQAGMTQATSPEEKSALTKVMWYGVLGIVGIVGGWAITFFIFGAVFVSAANLNLPPNPTPAQVGAALGPVFQNLSLLLPAILAIALVGDALLTMALRDLAKVDNSKFSLPWKFMIVTDARPSPTSPIILRPSPIFFNPLCQNSPILIFSAGAVATK